MFEIYLSKHQERMLVTFFTENIDILNYETYDHQMSPLTNLKKYMFEESIEPFHERFMRRETLTDEEIEIWMEQEINEYQDFSNME